MRIKKFHGINNVSREPKLQPGELLTASNLEVGDEGNLVRRRGRTLLQAGYASSVYVAPFGVFALLEADLILMDAAGTLLRTVYPALGYTRVWYALLPDGRVAFSNGLIQGLATSTETTGWGIPIPPDAGVAEPGTVPYMITYVRTSDGREGPPLYAGPIDPTLSIYNLPTVEGFSINVYLAPHNETMFLAGNTTTNEFLYGGQQLGPAFIGDGLVPPPTGIMPTAWRSRVLIADGNVLWATRPFQPELCDLTQDFVQFPDPITAIYGTNEGVFVGTTKALHFLAGTAVAEWKAVSLLVGQVTKGSVVEVDKSYFAEKVRPSGADNMALCMVDGYVHALFGAGQTICLTAERYCAPSPEVFATIRQRGRQRYYVAAHRE